MQKKKKVISNCFVPFSLSHTHQVNVFSHFCFNVFVQSVLRWYLRIVISSFQPLFPTAVHAISNSHSLLLFVCSFIPSCSSNLIPLSKYIYALVFFHSLFHSPSPISFRFPDAIVHRKRCQQFSSTFIPSWYWNWYWNWYELQSLSSSCNVCPSAKKVRTSLERIQVQHNYHSFYAPIDV